MSPGLALTVVLAGNLLVLVVLGLAGLGAEGLLAAALLTVTSAAAWWLRDRCARRLPEADVALTRRLRQTEELKADLTAVVCHEFRSPLTAILGFARTLRARIDELDRQEALACADAIEDQARRLARLVHEVVAASGEIGPQSRSTADLSAVAVEVAAELTDLASAGGRVTVDSPPGLVAALSPEAARLVLAHLLDNALKFAAPGSVVEVRGRRAGNMALVEVSNVGQPIPEAARGRIFEPFVQADSSDTRAYGGIGLGLSIVRKIVDGHGGLVEVRGDGARTIFSVSLPAGRQTQPPVSHPAPPRLAAASAAG
ncbi:MAG TPA: HAMP domain-containing sensor histidine kinase [Egibacteraceae bacterium]|nr:HAMP domain-containing histidine kinase [Actinomycetota bacterium]HWB70741.1 HAMP domain-containing sensor histidine kinase [Egibacteraceae bacterium]